MLFCSKINDKDINAWLIFNCSKITQNVATSVRMGTLNTTLLGKRSPFVSSHFQSPDLHPSKPIEYDYMFDLFVCSCPKNA